MAQIYLSVSRQHVNLQLNGIATSSSQHLSGCLRLPNVSAYTAQRFAIGSRYLLGLATLYVLTCKGPISFVPVDMSAHLLSLNRLREVGEALARRFPGTSNSGMRKRVLMPVDWDRVRDSCRAPQLSGVHTPEEVRLILVTGSAGFIGMHTAISLRKRGARVLGIDNFNDYYPVALKRARQLHAQAAGVYTIDGDLNDISLLRKLFQAGVRHALVNPMSYVDSNLRAQVVLFEVAKEQQSPPAIIYASSSSVYGLNIKQPSSEDDKVDSPASLYAATKKADELIAHSYYHLHGISMTGLRFFTVYGPWGRPDMAVFRFAVNMMVGDDLYIFEVANGTDSDLSRDFTYIDDIVHGVIAAAESAKASKPGEAEYRIFNLGNNHPETVTELVSLLETFLGRRARKQYLSMPSSGDLLLTHANISKAEKDLHYQPLVSLAEGLQCFVSWFMDYYTADFAVTSKLPGDWRYNAV